MFDYESLDPGIRKVVRLLHEWGFSTTDSGDGVSKLSPDAPAADDVIPWPHVFIETTPANLVKDAVRLYAKLLEHGVNIGPCEDQVGGPFIDASYDPGNGSAIIALMNCGDEDLEG